MSGATPVFNWMRSREAMLERGSLEEQLSELQKDLANEQAEHAQKAVENQLDEELKAFQDNHDKEIDVIREFLTDNEAINRAAILELEDMNRGLFERLTEYASAYTDATREELIAMWNEAVAAAEKYGSITNAAKVYQDGNVNSEVQAVIQKMRNNGNRWATTSSQTIRDQVANDSLKQGERLEELLGVPVWRDTNGVWWIGDKTPQKLFEVYHAGTPSVGQMPTLKQNEIWAKLEKGEAVYTRKHQEVLHGMLLSDLSERLGNAAKLTNQLSSVIPSANEAVFNIDASLNIDGMMPEEQIIRVIKNQQRKIADIVAGELRKL